MVVTPIRASMHQAQSRPEGAFIVPKAKSSLVRRLVAAQNDPAKRRIRIWLTDLDDQQLSHLGLTRDDIAILRRFS